VDVSVSFRQIARDIVGPEKYLQCASSSHQTRQPCHWPTAGDDTSPNFEVRQNSFFAAGETHVTGESKLTSDTCGPTPNQGDRGNRCAAQPHKHIGKRLQPCGPGRQAGCVLNSREKIVMSQKEPRNGAVKNDHFYLLVGFHCCDSFVELWNSI